MSRVIDFCCKKTLNYAFSRRLRGKPGDYIWCPYCDRRWLYENGAWWRGTVVQRAKR